MSNNTCIDCAKEKKYWSDPRCSVCSKRYDAIMKRIKKHMSC